MLYTCIVIKASKFKVIKSMNADIWWVLIFWQTLIHDEALPTQPVPVIIAMFLVVGPRVWIAYE